MPDFGFDEWLNAQLRNVPVPRNWHARLSAGRPPSDDELDDLVRDVDVPPELGAKLRRVARQTPQPWRWQPAALAASVLLLLSAGGYLALRPGAADTPAPKVAGQTPALSRQTAPPRAVASRPNRAPQQPAEVTTAPRRQEVVTVPLGNPTPEPDERPEKFRSALDNVAAAGTSFKQALNARLREERVLGAAGEIQRLPELAVLEPLPARGVRPPRVRGYDMLFQLRHGEHPFVSPAAHDELRAGRVPFTFQTTSYDRAAADVAAGQLPPADEIRVEDFLAAQRYALPRPPAAGLSLHAAVSPAPLGEVGLNLLQVAVQGARVQNPARKPLHLIAVVDTSAAMQHASRSTSIERALADLARQLKPADRLTLIGFAQRPHVLAEDADRDQLDALLTSGVLQKTTGSADLAAAIQSACDAVQAVRSDEARCVVFITAGRGTFTDDDETRSRESLLQLAAASTPWQIVRISPSGDDPRFDDLARRAHGRTGAVNSAAELYAVLLEAVTGHPQTVAQAVSMRITFNPKVVTSYRLLGHESATLTGEATDPLQIDLHAEQTATAMYEMWLKPAGKGDVAVVEVLWRDPRGGQPRRSVQSIPRGRVDSFSAAPPWIQQGIVAARTAELLRGSYYAPRSRRFDQLRELAQQVDPRAAQMSEFQDLVRLLDGLCQLR